MWWYFTSITILLSVFYPERVLNFIKCFFASIEMIRWLFFPFVNVAYYIDISLYMLNHPHYHSRSKSYCVLVYNPFTMPLNSVC